MKQLICSFVVLAAANAGAQPYYSYAVPARQSTRSDLELLLRDDPKHLLIELGSEFFVHSRLGSTLAKQPGARFLQAQDTAIQRSEFLIQGHSCAVHDTPKLWAIVGGFDLIKTSSTAKLHLEGQALLQPVPDHGVVARLASSQNFQAKAVRSSVAEVVARVDAGRWYQTLSTLAGFNRNSFSTQLFTARDWIGQRFASSGLSVSDFNFQLANITSCTPTPAPVQLPNIVGLKTGLALPNEWVVIGAHYDSRNPARCDGSVQPQPGANDNASGCAGVIELAQVFADLSTDRSMLFMCFSGEEQGLVGSTRYVDSLRASGELSKIKLMLNSCLPRSALLEA